MKDEIRESILKDVHGIVTRKSDQYECEVCKKHLEKKDFEVLTYYSTYIMMCTACVHDLVNMIIKLTHKKQQSIQSPEQETK